MLVVGDPTAVSVDGLVAELARRYDLPASSMMMHRLSPNEFLLVLSNEDDDVRVYNEERPIQISQITLHCRRWSRFMKATGVTLPHLVDVEIRGIPAHVWELDTAEHLLDEWCWVRALHPDTVDRRDYSTFRLSAWCSHPEEIPAAMDLVVVEPPAPVAEAPPVKRALSYDVQITMVPEVGRSAGAGAPPAPPPDGHGGGHRRRRDSRSTGASPRSSGDGSLPEVPRLVSGDVRARDVKAAARECRSLTVRCAPGWRLPHATRQLPRRWRPSSLICPRAMGECPLEIRQSRWLEALMTRPSSRPPRPGFLRP